MSFTLYSVHFVRNICAHFCSILPVTKINIFELAEPYILKSILAVNGKQVGVREHGSCEIR